MNKRVIIYTALAGMVALYLWDQGNRTETVLPAVVEALEERDDTEGAASWVITARIGADEIALAPLSARPDVAPGARICVTRVMRPNQPDEYRRASAGTDC